MKKNLTLRYSLQQMVHSSAYATTMTFASAFLIANGFSVGYVGVLLALGNLLSCGVQPLLAARIDRQGGHVVPRYMAALCMISTFSFLSLLILPDGHWSFGLMYLLGVFTYDVMTPLANALCVAWRREGHPINYGVGRGMGSLAYSLLALVIGRIMADWGEDWMVWISAMLLMTDMLVVLSFPRIHPAAVNAAKPQCCSIGVFLKRYKWYCASLVGVMLLASFHIMVENYLIKVMERLGGDSSHVGVAMFIATSLATVTMIFFDRLRNRTGSVLLLKLAGLFYIIKSVTLLLAPSIGVVYAAQALQMVTYVFLSPTQMYYANSRIAPEDMVKGQAFITAAYTLGCALGNFTGGQVVEAWGVGAMLMTGVAIAAAGALLICVTVGHKDRYMQEAR